MDMRKYSSGFVKPDDVRDGPLQAHIINVVISEKYNRPVLELDTGDQFTVNAKNNRVLCKAYGPNSEDWRGNVVEFSLGHYKDCNTDTLEEKETVAIKAISLRGAPSATADRNVSIPPSCLRPARCTTTKFHFSCALKKGEKY